MPVEPYINFDGNCREAVAYYAKVFGVEQGRTMTFGEGPSDPNYPMPEDAKNRVMHTYLDLVDTRVMFSDTWPGMELVKGNNVSLTVVTTNKDDIVKWFTQLKEGGTVNMDLQETFWSKCYGSLRDKHGVEWQFSLDSGEVF